MYSYIDSIIISQIKIKRRQEKKQIKKKRLYFPFKVKFDAAQKKKKLFSFPNINIKYIYV